VSAPNTPGENRRARLLRWGLLAVAGLVAVALLILLLPDDDQDGSSSAASTTSAATPSAPETDPDAEPTPTEPPAPVTEAPAPTVAAREGVPESARTVAAETAAFTAPAGWADGATVRVTDASQQTTDGTGPGELAGQPQTVFSLEITNGSAAALDLNAVIVQATYGAETVQAAPLYDEETIDFGGVLEPGGTATAVYSFAIPADQLGDVTLSVDVDGYRFPAVFTGAVPAA
jgi:hypothetical protein